MGFGEVGKAAKVDEIPGCLEDFPTVVGILN